MSGRALPTSDNEYLSAFIAAVRSRSRALKHKFQEVSCEHSVPDERGGARESITLLLRGSRRDSLQVSLRLWADRWCRFDARKGAKQVWAFAWFYDGRVAPERTGAELVAALEHAHEHVWAARPDEAALEAIWAPLLLRGPKA